MYEFYSFFSADLKNEFNSSLHAMQLVWSRSDSENPKTFPIRTGPGMMVSDRIAPGFQKMQILTSLPDTVWFLFYFVWLTTSENQRATAFVITTRTPNTGEALSYIKTRFIRQLETWSW